MALHLSLAQRHNRRAQLADERLEPDGFDERVAGHGLRGIGQAQEDHVPCNVTHDPARLELGDGAKSVIALIGVAIHRMVEVVADPRSKAPPGQHLSAGDAVEAERGVHGAMPIPK